MNREPSGRAYLGFVGLAILIYFAASAWPSGDQHRAYQDSVNQMIADAQ